MGLWSSLRKSTSPSSPTSGGGGGQSSNASLEAINKIRSTLDILSKKEAFLEQRMATEQQVALRDAKSNRGAAIQAMQRRKLLSGQCERIRAARFNLELQLLAIENATLNLETMEAMRQGSQAIKALHGAVSVERVDETMDEIREQMDVAKEIGEAISSPLGTSATIMGDVVDDEELEKELEALQQQEVDERLSRIPLPPTTVKTTERALKSPPAPESIWIPSSTSPTTTTTTRKQEEESTEDVNEELERLKTKMASG